jgi:hypothetical protein
MDGILLRSLEPGEVIDNQAPEGGEWALVECDHTGGAITEVRPGPRVEPILRPGAFLLAGPSFNPRVQAQEHTPRIALIDRVPVLRAEDCRCDDVSFDAVVIEARLGIDAADRVGPFAINNMLLMRMTLVSRSMPGKTQVSK